MTSMPSRGKNSLGPKTKIKLSVDTSNPTICPDITGLLVVLNFKRQLSCKKLATNLVGLT